MADGFWSEVGTELQDTAKLAIRGAIQRQIDAQQQQQQGGAAVAAGGATVADGGVNMSLMIGGGVAVLALLALGIWAIRKK